VKPIVFHPNAEQELEEAIARYEAQRTGLGLALSAEVESAVGMIQNHPGMHPQHKETDYRKCVLRRFPYNIFYREREDSIWIIAVAHQKRKPDYWARRSAE
jgi:toxin ParE1/3/4